MCSSAVSALAKRAASSSARIAVSDPSVPTTIDSDNDSSSPVTARRRTLLQRRRVGTAEATVDEERRRRDVARLVAGEEDDGAGDLLGARETAHRHVHEAAGRLLGVLRIELFQQWRVDGPGAQRVDADAAAGELDAELA